MKRIVLSLVLKALSIGAAAAAFGLAAWWIAGVSVTASSDWSLVRDWFEDRGVLGGLLMTVRILASFALSAGVLCGLAVLFRRLAVVSAKLGRQVTVPTAGELLARDSRPPVLYLRSFFDDMHGDEGNKNLVSSLSSRTEEEQIAKVVSELGPFVAVGKPGESRPILGAARAYLPDSEWQHRVKDLLASSQLVLLRTGLTAGFAWELARAVELVRPERLVLLVDEGDFDFEFFRGKVGGLLPKGLPALTDSRKENGPLRGLVVFGAAWEPGYVPIEKKRSPLLRRSVAYPLAAPLKYAMRSTWEQLNVKWRPPPLGALQVGFLALVAWTGFSFLRPAVLSLFQGRGSTYHGPSVTPVPEPAAEADPRGLALEESERAFVENPEVKAWAGRVFGDRDPSDADITRASMKLVNVGLLRLDDALVHRWLELRLAMWNSVTSEQRPQLVDGSLSAAGRAGLLDALAPEQMEQWFDIVGRARLAEIRQMPSATGVSEREVRRLLQKVEAAFRGRAQIALYRVLQDPQNSKGEPRFLAEVALMQVLLSFSPADSSSGARWLAQGQAR